MTTPEALNALADRVEREEPSVKLKHAIATALGWTWVQFGYVQWRNPSGRDASVPNWLESLDAAVTLVPEGWIIAHLSEIGGDGLPSCTLTTGSNDVAGFCLEAPTSGITALARATVAAALRARAAMERT